MASGTLAMQAAKKTAAGQDPVTHREARGETQDVRVQTTGRRSQEKEQEEEPSSNQT